MSKAKVDFGRIRKDIKEVTKVEEDLDRLDCFIKLRKIYNLLAAMYKGGVQVVNSNFMTYVPLDVMTKHLDVLAEVGYSTCDMAEEMSNCEPKPEEKENVTVEEKPKPKKPAPPKSKKKEISYLV